MKRTLITYGLLSCLGLVPFTSARAQDLPKAQPKLLTIIREEVKTGRGPEHSKHETGWPAAYEKAKSPDYYLALVSMTGPTEAWYLIPAESHAQIAESMKREDKDPVLSADLSRLALADAEYVNRVTTLNLAARPDLSFGPFPDLAKTRFFEVSIFRVRPGQGGQGFEEMARAFGSARKRVAPNAGYRVYQLTAGMPGPAFFVISSVENFAAFDQRMADDEATFKGANGEELAAFAKWGDAILSEETQRFRVDPVQSYVPRETRAQDPEFWQGK